MFRNRVHQEGLGLRRWLVPLLLCGALAGSAARGVPVRIGNPLLARYPVDGDARPRSIWDLHTFNGRMYIGHGDYWFNRGPIDIWTYRGSGTRFEKDETVAEEMVWDFFEYDNKLFIPGYDATDNPDTANLYINDPVRSLGSGWRRLSTLRGGIHSFDVAPFRGTLFASMTLVRGGRTLMSTNMGRTWKPFLKQYSSFAVFDDFIFLEGDRCYLYDGESLRPVAPNLHVPMLSMSRRARFQDGLLYSYPLRYGLARNPLYFITADQIAQGQEAMIVPAFAHAKVRDIVVRGDVCYVMTADELQRDARYRGSIYASSDLRNWTLASRFSVPGIPLSFEILNNQFYVGLGSRFDSERGWESLVGPEAGSLWAVAPAFSDIRARPTLAKRGGEVTITFSVPKNVSAWPVVTVNGRAASFASKSRRTYTYRYRIQAADRDGAAIIDISGQDTAGNRGGARQATALRVDQTIPGATVSRIGTSSIHSRTVQFLVDFSEAVLGFTAGDLVLGGTAPGKAITGFSALSASRYRVTVGGIAGAGTVTLAVASNRCADAAGNANRASSSIGYVIVKQTIGLALGGLTQTFDGTPRPVTATTAPAGLRVDFTYNGASVPPTEIGRYAVTGTVNDAWYAGNAVGFLVISPLPGSLVAWLHDRGLSSLDPRFAADSDDDGDGMTTLEEFLADTDPANPGSVFDIHWEYVPAVAPGATGEMRLAFPASTGRYYQLEYSTNLLAPAAGLSNLGWGVPGMVITNNSPGTWYGVIRSRLAAP